MGWSTIIVLKLGVPKKLHAPDSSSALPGAHYKSSSQISGVHPSPISSCVNGPPGFQTSYSMAVLLCWTQTEDSCTMTQASCRYGTGLLGCYITPVLPFLLPLIGKTDTSNGTNIIWELNLPSVAATVSISVSVGASHFEYTRPHAQ